MTYATPKRNCNPAAARERGRRDKLTGFNNADFLPCPCDKCRTQYLLGWREVFIANESIWRTK